MFEIELFWHLTECKQKTILILNWIVWNIIMFSCIKMDLALNNLQWLICHKTKPNQTKLKINNFLQYLLRIKITLSLSLFLSLSLSLSIYLSIYIYIYPNSKKLLNQRLGILNGFRLKNKWQPKMTVDLVLYFIYLSYANFLLCLYINWFICNILLLRKFSWRYSWWNLSRRLQLFYSVLKTCPLPILSTF